MRVLLVEDELRISRLVARGLTEQGYSVDELALGARVLSYLQAGGYQCLILDVMLPDVDGLTVLKNVRHAGITVPIILLTARNELEDRLAGLNLGADDYVGKPFFVEELAARVHVVVRRKIGQPTDQLQVAGLVLDRLKRQVGQNGRETSLTAREFSLLECLMQYPGRVFTRTHLLQRVWGFDFDPSTNVVDVCVQRIRRKIDTAGSKSWVASIRGVGYSFRPNGNE